MKDVMDEFNQDFPNVMKDLTKSEKKLITRPFRRACSDIVRPVFLRKLDT